MRKWYIPGNLDINRDSLFVLVMCHGGIDYKREFMKGECRYISEHGRGRFCINKNGEGKTFDDFTQLAVEYGYLHPEAGITDFIDALIDDMSGRFRRYSLYRDVDPIIQGIAQAVKAA